MARDYVRDITPPAGERAPRASGPSSDIRPPTPPSPPDDGEPAENAPIRTGNVPPPPQSPAVRRGIRNIPPLRLRPRIGADMRDGSGPPSFDAPSRARRVPSAWLWALAGISLLALIALGFLALRPTTVTVTPKSHTVILSDSAQLTAYPVSSSTPEALTYALRTSEFEDSEAVPSQGSVHVENKASGSVTAFNSYSAASVRLVKNTRFQSSNGLIFRVPADVVIPGGSGKKPGQVSVTVIADQPGKKYNIVAGRFTLPGLKENGAMYAGVYARSSAAFSGGLVGEQPGVAPGALDAAQALVRGRLEAKARDSLVNDTSSTVLFPDLVRTTYESEPNTTEAGGGVRIHEKVRVDVPVFPTDLFAETLAGAASADAEGAPVSLLPGSDFRATIASTTAAGLRTGPIRILLSGSATFVWKVDAQALARALAGRDSAAFKTIVNGFPGVEEAHAKIEPFWKSAFPADPSKINVTILEVPTGR